MSSRVKELEREKILALREEEAEVQKISAMMEEMSVKIAENRAIFRE